ncbi:MAG: cell division FtsA domain-containing protein, partial [Prevotella sp.]|nr:cell division FtsA domain-containing protein [Prevotella sp.]
SLQMEENEAEEMKLKYASAYTEIEEIDSSKTLAIDAERTVPMQAFIELVEARVNEIIENVWFGQVPPEYKDKLLGGIILTGGGSKMKDIKKAFTAITGVQKIRIAGTVAQKVSSNDKDINAHDGTMNTALGLLAKGDINCAGSTINPNTDLFDTDGRTSTPSVDIPRKERDPRDTGVVMTPAEKQRLEQERIRREEEAERIRREKELDKEEPEEPSKGGLFSRAISKLQDFGRKLISEENDDDINR